MDNFKEYTYKMFPNTSTIASYNPYNQIININKYDAKVVQDALIKPSYDNIDIIKTYVHELRHWKDHHTTLWGLKNLIATYNAINARVLNDPSNFHHIPNYFTQSKESFLTEYYHTHPAEFDVEKNRIFWKWDTSIGLRFTHEGHSNQDSPILFVNFRNPMNNELIYRTPIGISSILETNAMAEEAMIAHSLLRNSNKEEMELAIESKLLEKEYRQWLYSSEFTLYSAVAHLVSCLSDRGDIDETLLFASQISNLVLSLPAKYYDRIPMNAAFEGLRERAYKLRGNLDLGYMFLNLLYNYRDTYDPSTGYNLTDLLKASGIPDISVVEKDIIEEFERLRVQIIDGPFYNLINTKLNIAIDYFKAKGFKGANESALDFIHYDIPSVIYGDTIFGDIDDSIDMLLALLSMRWVIPLDIWYTYLEDIYDEMHTFYNICGV